MNFQQTPTGAVLRRIRWAFFLFGGWLLLGVDMADDFETRLRLVEERVNLLWDRWEQRAKSEARQRTTLPSWFGVVLSALMFLAMLFGYYLQYMMARMP